MLNKTIGKKERPKMKESRPTFEQFCDKEFPCVVRNIKDKFGMDFKVIHATLLNMYNDRYSAPSHMVTPIAATKTSNAKDAKEGAVRLNVKQAKELKKELKMKDCIRVPVDFVTIDQMRSFVQRINNMKAADTFHSLCRPQ